MKNKITRREFLKSAGLAVGGAAAGVVGTDLFFDSLRPVPKAIGHVVQLPPEESTCTGCGTCELVCAAAHGQLVGPSTRRIWLMGGASNLDHRVFSCQQCEHPACYYACPRKGVALRIDSETNARFIDSGQCPMGCQSCLKACALDPPRINYDGENKLALMCDLCKDRAKGPACVEYCPSQCLQLKVLRI